MAASICIDPVDYGRPTKRSMTIAGHETSISLEPVFWRALEQAAEARARPLSALVAEIDAERIAARPAPNLTSALRQWLWVNRAADRGGE